MLHSWHGLRSSLDLGATSRGGKLSSTPLGVPSPVHPPEGSTERQESPKPSGVPAMTSAHTALLQHVQWLCWCGNPAPALSFLLLPPVPPGLDRLHSGKMQWLTPIIFLDVSLERQGYEGKEHKTQPECPLRKRPPPGWFHHPSPGSLPSPQASPTCTAESGYTLPELCLRLSTLTFLQMDTSFGYKCECLWLLCLGPSSWGLSCNDPCLALHCGTSTRDEPLPRVLTQAAAPPHLQCSFC